MKKMERRVFLGRMAALGLGLMALTKGAVSWAKGLPSDPDGAAGAAGAAPGADSIALPPFEKTAAFQLEKALLERKSARSYDPSKKLTREELSRLLWAADGVSRPDGKRTTPSAKSKYFVDVVVALPEGVYLYEPKDHRLKRLIADDIRAAIPTQAGFKSAAMILLYVIQKERVSGGRMEWADLEIGCIGQNLYLEATAMGLGSCIFAGVDYERVSKAIGLKEDQVLRIAQAVGATK
jgi:SagB-type dehydrogenase family enzyme